LFVDGGEVADRADVSLSGFKITPGFGFRMATLLGPIRLDIGINPYPIAHSRLFQESGGNLVLVNPDYQPAAKWYDRFRINFSIGQAF
jgi:hypothetical protein